jgi:hypothetical protein
MKKTVFFHFVAILFIFAGCENEVSNYKSKIAAEQSSCCKDLAKDTITYQPQLNPETMHYLHGHIDGLMNGKTVHGYSDYILEDNNSIQLKLMPWIDSINNIMGVLHIKGKKQFDKVLSIKDIEMYYVQSLKSCQAQVYYLDSSQTTVAFLKYTKANEQRINGCLSATFCKSSNRKDSKTELPDTISFKDIRFSAILQD